MRDPDKEFKHTCPHCGKIFRAWYKPNQVACSTKCANAMRRNRVRKTCAICGKPFDVFASRKKQTHCSVMCMEKARRKVMQRPNIVQLAVLLLQRTQGAIGKSYGVCAGSVGFWAEAYGLRTPTVRTRSSMKRMAPIEHRALVDKLLDRRHWSTEDEFRVWFSTILDDVDNRWTKPEDGKKCK